MGITKAFVLAEISKLEQALLSQMDAVAAPSAEATIDAFAKSQEREVEAVFGVDTSPSESDPPAQGAH